MSGFNPIIIINANMASKGHQIGRLIASCDNIAWYDHANNGEHPWLPCKNILNAELSHFHYDRRFADSTSIPPVLDYARRSGLPEKPILSYDKCQDGQHLLYLTHSNLDESRNYFKGRHVVVLDEDPERFMETTWNFRVGKTKKLISELYTEEEVKSMLTNTLINYEINIKWDDFVIDTIDELFDMDNFKLLCNQFDLQFNETRYNKVKDFLAQ
tara:strand:+ start:3324 stop:3965 length:642 start_codon:yes stop_codon:yes gene_type:complete